MLTDGPVKLNLGCGKNKYPGYVNIDKETVFEPDLTIDLEQTPWDLADDCADMIVLNHVLEHLGRDPQVFLAIMKELYRVARDQCILIVNVPHPLHSDFRTDPTHVRSIGPDTMMMFSKEACDFWEQSGYANTAFAHICEVDFELTSIDYIPDRITAAKLEELGLLKESDNLAELAEIFNNLVKEVKMQLIAHK